MGATSHQGDDPGSDGRTPRLLAMVHFHSGDTRLSDEGRCPVVATRFARQPDNTGHLFVARIHLASLLRAPGGWWVDGEGETPRTAR